MTPAIRDVESWPFENGPMEERKAIRIYQDGAFVTKLMPHEGYDRLITFRLGSERVIMFGNESILDSLRIKPL